MSFPMRRRSYRRRRGAHGEEAVVLDGESDTAILGSRAVVGGRKV